MTTATFDLTTTRIAKRGWTRYVPSLGGLGLVAGLIAIFVSPASDDTGETAAEVVAYAQSHEGWTVAILLFGVASLALGATFTAGLHARLTGIATATESSLVLLGGAFFTLCFALCWIIWTAPLADVSSTREIALLEAQAYLSYDDIGWFVLGAGGVAAAVMAIPASLAAIRAGLPAWLGWLGVLAGIGSLGTFAFFGMFAWMAWIAVASLVLLLSAARDE
jgi:hypothetical protein